MHKPVIVRRLDELGRLAIPKEFLIKLGLEGSRAVRILWNKNSISMEPVIENYCILCRKAKTPLIEYENKGYICQDCISKIKNLKTE